MPAASFPPARNMRSRPSSATAWFAEACWLPRGYFAGEFSPLERNLNLAEYKNPQQEPGGDRRMLMVFAVTFALIIISQIFLFKDKSKPQPKSAPDQTSQSNAPQS